MHKSRKISQFIAFNLFRLSITIIIGGLFVFLLFIAINGIEAISWEFLTEKPQESMTKGGILPCILGTIYLSFGAVLAAFPLGVCTAIYLNEFAKSSKWLHLIRLGINTLAGVPSVVYGLFGLALFVTWFQFDVSLLSGMLTLGAFILPLIIGTAEEALRTVPQTYREASLALGATKFQTIFRVVLPAAFPNMLTGLILGLSRVAGETAPIMFTGALYYTRELPDSLFDPVMALPYHIFVLATSGTHIQETRPMQYGTALVLISLVLIMNLMAIFIRSRLQKRR